MPQADQQSTVDEVERLIAQDFAQRGHRLQPLNQADIDAAINRAEDHLRLVAQQARERSEHANHLAARTAGFINEVVLSGALLNALNRRRQSTR